MRPVCAICCFAVISGCAHLSDTSLVVAARVDHIDLRAKEPMVVEHPDGTLFVSGYGRPAGLKLWKSADHGATWTRVNVGSEADGAIGGSDVDLAVARDGTLYFVTMKYDREAHEGRSVSIGVSKDAGATWRWTMLSEHRFDDRPWVAVAADGTAHAIWNDGSGVNHSVSRDGGVTWVRQVRICGQGGSSHLAVGPNQEVAVRVTPLSASGGKYDPGVDLIAVSVDGGATWQNRPAPGHREWGAFDSSISAAMPRWVEPLAWDAEGALYSFWADGKELWLARSLDQGGTWTNWHVGSTEEVSYYPYLVARGRGELAATWFSGQGDKALAHVARIDVGSGTAPPKMMEAPAFHPDTWRPGDRPEDPPVRDVHAGGEYMPAVFLRGGGFAVVSPITNLKDQRFGFSWVRLEAR